MLQKNTVSNYKIQGKNGHFSERDKSRVESRWNSGIKSGADWSVARKQSS